VIAYLILVACICCCALFAGYETGYYVLNRIRLNLRYDMGNRSARIIKRFSRRREHFLATLLVGNNVFVQLFSGVLTFLFIQAASKQPELLSTLVATPLVFVFAEVIPKYLFQQYANGLTYVFAPLVRFFYWVFYPVSLLLQGISIFVARMLGVRRPAQSIYHRDNLIKVIHMAYDEALIDLNQKKVLDSVMMLKEITVQQVMRRRSQTVCVPSGLTVAQAQRTMRKYPFKRFPVLDGRTQRVKGIVNVLSVLWHAEPHLPVGELAGLTAPLRLAVDCSLLLAIQEMQREKVLMAVVVSNNQFVGVVTINDIMAAVLQVA